MSNKLKNGAPKTAPRSTTSTSSNPKTIKSRTLLHMNTLSFAF